MTVNQNYVRMTEALLFASAEPLDQRFIESRLPEDANVPLILRELQSRYADRGVELVMVAGKWAFRTAPDLAHMFQEEREVPRRLSRAGIETLAIIAYHQPITRAEIEEVRGVGLSKGTLDVLMEIGWIRPKGRRRTPGRPVTYGVTEDFLVHFGLESIEDLPGVEELRATGMLDAQPKSSADGGAAAVVTPLPVAAANEDGDEDASPAAFDDVDEPFAANGLDDPDADDDDTREAASGGAVIQLG